ncbi:MAG TPA: response regulator [Candidatus Binataceae bacterium]|nr:response regulator [Candidatus Binataceae bacterium]
MGADQDVVRATLRGTRLALINLSDLEAQRVKAVAEGLGAHIHVVTFDPALPRLNSLAPFDICIASISRNGDASSGFGSGFLGTIHPPAIVIGDENDLANSTNDLQSVSRDFMIRPWTETELTLRAFRVLSFAQAEEEDRTFALSRSSAEDPTVVVADDDRITVTLLTSMLRTCGINCVTASDGHAALELVRKLKPDALVLDISMPHMSGFEVLSAIRKDASVADTPVIMLTASQVESEIVRSFSEGADDYVTKPFHPNEMMARLKRLVRRRAAV